MYRALKKERSKSWRRRLAGNGEQQSVRSLEVEGRERRQKSSVAE